MNKINPQDIVAYESFSAEFPLKTDIVYANGSHPENAFGQIYHTDALIWGHRDMVKVVLLAAKRLNRDFGWVLTVKDCLRPVEAQAKMVETPIVKANPHWIVEPRFLSGPGQGGHPRGMAVDLDVDGVDFGTPFDFFSASTAIEHNKAHRAYPHHAEIVYKNRDHLEKAMVKAAEDFDLPMLPLPQEWWDFRFPKTYTDGFEPLHDADLWPHQKITTQAKRAPLEMDQSIVDDVLKHF